MGRRAVGALLSLALVAIACSPGESAATPWGARAEAWTAAFTAADPVASAPFYDPDVVLEMHGLLAEGYGVQGLVEMATDPDLLTSVGYALDLAAPPFLSREGAVLQVRSQIGVAWVLRIGRAGIERQSWIGSAAGARGVLPDLVDERLFRQLPEQFLQAWSGRDLAAVAQVYAPDATVVDTLADVQLAGADAIAEAVRAGGTGPWLLDEARLAPAPERDDDAVYVAGWARPGGQWDRVLLVLDARLSPGCSGAVAAVLDVRQGAVVRDERFYRIDAVRRCLPDVADEGWWSRAVAAHRAAAPALVEVPGRLRTDVVGGDERTASLLLWAAGRFAAAGLPPPAAPTAVVVSPDPGRCLTAGHRSSSLVLELCGAGPEVCADAACATTSVDARAAALHQLGHQWVDRREPGAATCPAVTDRPGREACLDPPLDRQAERNADVLTWGLMDEAWTSSHLDGLACGELDTRFRRLTGTAPLRRCGAAG